jgi:hypothetical protein
MKMLFTLAIGGLLLLSACTERVSGITATPRYRYGGGVGKIDQFNKKDFDPRDTRMMIFNASLKLSVKNADSLNHQLSKLTAGLEGYAVTLGNSRSTIRIPATRLNDAINGISKLGKMSEKKLTGSDVTDEFNDYDVRLDNANKARERYLELLQKAENVEAALKVEKELERLNGEIELLKGKMERVSHLVSYSTIEIDIHEREKLGVIGYLAIGTYKAVKWLFVRG